MRKVLRRIFKNDSIDFKKDLNRNLNYDLNSDAYKAIRIVRNNTMLPYKNLVTLFEQVAYCEKNDIPGAYVECGVWKGGAMGLMALANMKYGKAPRQLHLFDIFDNICEPDPVYDGSRALSDVEIYGKIKASNITGELKSIKGFYNSFGGYGSLEENMKLFSDIIKYDKKYVFYNKGWFQDTVPEISSRIKNIAILRLDGDWYYSTKVCIEHLFDKVSKGGIIIIDDYGLYEGCRKAVDEFLVSRNLNYFINYSDEYCRYIIK
jgi:O-methyltransferase